MVEQNERKKHIQFLYKSSFLAVLAMGILTIIGISFTGIAFAQEDKQKNIEMVEGFLSKAYDDKDPAGAVEEYLSEDFLSGGQIDKERATAIVDKIHKMLPDLVRTSEPAVADEDGNFIVVFNKWNSSKGGTESADLFKVQNGKIVEHTQLGKYPDEILVLFNESLI